MFKLQRKGLSFMRKLFFHTCIQISLLSTFLSLEWIESKRKFRRIAKSFHRKLFPQKLWTLRSYINILFFPLSSRRDAVWSCACNSSNNQSTSESSSNKKVDFENLALKLEFSREERLWTLRSYNILFFPLSLQRV